MSNNSPNNIAVLKANYGLDLSFLEGILPGKLPTQKEKIDIEELSGEIDINPIAYKPKSLTDFNALASICSTDTSRPLLTGIYRDSHRQQLVATDGKCLVVIPSTWKSTPMVWSDIIHPKSLEKIEGKFPDYADSIPFLVRRTVIDSPIDFVCQLKGLSRANRFVRGKMIYARLMLNGRLHVYDPDLLLKVMCTLLDSGTSSLFIEHYRFNQRTPDPAIILRDVKNPRKFGVVMAVIPGFDMAYKTVIDSATYYFEKENVTHFIQENLGRVKSKKPGELQYAEDQIQKENDSKQPNERNLAYWQGVVVREKSKWEEEIAWWKQELDQVTSETVPA